MAHPCLAAAVLKLVSCLVGRHILCYNRARVLRAPSRRWNALFDTIIMVFNGCVRRVFTYLLSITVIL